MAFVNSKGGVGEGVGRCGGVCGLGGGGGGKTGFRNYTAEER